MRTPSKTDFQKTAFPPSPLKAGTTFALRSNRKEGTKKKSPTASATPRIDAITIITLTSLSPNLSSSHFSNFDGSSSISVDSIALSAESISAL